MVDGEKVEMKWGQESKIGCTYSVNPWSSTLFDTLTSDSLFTPCCCCLVISFAKIIIHGEGLFMIK